MIPETSTWEPSWLPRAVDRWSARTTEPLTVRAWLAAPMAHDPFDLVTLDGALSWAVVRDAAECNPSDAFDGQPRGAWTEIPMPLA